MQPEERPAEASWSSIPIAALEHYAYCARQAALIHLERYFADNVDTARGQLAHDVVDRGDSRISRTGHQRWTALPVWEAELGVHGICDVVEFEPDGPVPVEHKSGSYRPGSAADLQVAAQALCLRSMFDAPVPKGIIFAGQNRRRYEVVIDEDLEARLSTAVAELRKLFRAGALPAAVNDSRCRRCSLREGCMPEARVAPPESLFTPQSLGDWDD
ncbi:CRISPR-associated Cas4 family exonuclease [Halopolyspora algeriensis]|uniref:CRISPR-associated exonuclease Cas4 n=1 Tax=Halopolyspora algeriensis TaxID=1500506 RepID=A0A368VVA5_9ACTN|nr:CRISPR-associated protein Cas4 [Halopolyspora algeriensis]RCW45123.1 CRISPR-associated Cas4 family exonuclease [Halopolyspora algeriensis]TQM53155.1 CRISPR-associated Cas4 family exonuclease [Halopolyspora algeriensis]